MDVTRQNVSQYGGAGSTRLYPAERRIVEQFLRPSMSILELGCGHGRVTKALAQNGRRLIAGDLSYDAVHVCRQTMQDSTVRYLQFDACRLPFKATTFDVVFFPFNGLDFIYPEAARLGAIEEMARVLSSGGYLIFSSHNPTGAVLSPRGKLWSPKVWQARQAMLQWQGEPYFSAGNNMLLYHAPPQKIVKQVTALTGMKLVAALERSGLALPFWLLRLVDPWPHYVFQK